MRACRGKVLEGGMGSEGRKGRGQEGGTQGVNLGYSSFILNVAVCKSPLVLLCKMFSMIERGLWCVQPAFTRLREV